MPRTHGYGQKGKRCFGTIDWHAKGRVNVMGALLGATLLSIGLVEGTINTDVFHAWLTHDLIPKLPSQSVIVMDNAAFHKRSDIENDIKKAGHELRFLPPYSPDLNPIERKWAQAKAIRRKTGKSTNEIFKNYF